MPLDITLDEEQQQLVKVFDKYIEYFKAKSLNKIFNIFKSTQPLFGIYIYGSVGRGKTMLTKKFYESLNVQKTFIHFQIFMKNIHEQLHLLRTQNNSTENLFKIIAAEYAKHTKIIFLDEFEIKDIADAMTLTRLIPELQKLKIYIVITTNIAPTNLYKDGIQRESFLPFIDYLNNNFEVIALTQGQDYRFIKNISLTERILFPASKVTKNILDRYIEQLTSGKFAPQTFEVYGRKITFPLTCKNILVTNFSEMFEEERSQADYIEICEHFDIIIIDLIKVIETDNKNIALRVINFLDQAYAARILIITQLVDHPEAILSRESGLREVARALSRIHEMNSEEYMKNSKYYINRNG
jgi:cell division protein ZapE